MTTSTLSRACLCPSDNRENEPRVPELASSALESYVSVSCFDELAALKPKKRRNSGGEEVALRLDGLDTNSDARVRFFSIRQKKSKRSLLRVSASLINLVSPSRNKNESCSFKVPSSPLRPVPAASPYKPPRPSPAKRRVQLSWVDSFGSNGDDKCTLSHHEIKRQEAIYELYQGERDMLEDLTNITKFYRDPLLKLGLISQEEARMFFGNIDSLIPVHEELINRLREQRKPDGRTENIGQHIHDWADHLSVYVQYCANQIKAKAVFDEKKNEPAMDDFLQRCLASPFSRKLDLWTLLDGARGRFVKYPLLVRAILKYLERLEKVIKKADEETGVARCEHSKSCLLYLFDDQKIPEIEQSTALLCNGCMKNVKGSKLFVFLFERAVVVTRSTHQQGRQMYQVYRQPMPVSELQVEDLPDGEVKLGSFRNAFGQGSQIAKNVIRISFKDSEKGQSHTLLANDEHDKRQWMQAFRKVTSCVEEVSENSNISKAKH
ncbi:neuroepithelial cell-transforming gene 1 protein [Plakobranchus ocellatus]|uniref:Neuroepithelial cell-transforming gene 1 protein n=1 Tax=Plakobranchus ocellatus TaxID=259542 RepID=A0AAV4CIF2_9GAST|nr:neuroepithelial cell-transforming gene 1 protein [Plakobranchus ocellatus]